MSDRVDGIPHGGSGGGYTHYGCRCDECRAANTARCRRARARRLERLAAGQAAVTHGSASTYTNWGCKCDECTQANTEKDAAYRDRDRYRRAN